MNYLLFQCLIIHVFNLLLWGIHILIDCKPWPQTSTLLCMRLWNSSGKKMKSVSSRVPVACFDQQNVVQVTTESEPTPPVNVAISTPLRGTWTSLDWPAGDGHVGYTRDTVAWPSQRQLTSLPKQSCPATASSSQVSQPLTQLESTQPWSMFWCHLSIGLPLCFMLIFLTGVGLHFIVKIKCIVKNVWCTMLPLQL